jgi:carbamoyltransferase
MYEEAFFALLNALHRRRPSDHLALSGGCAMNSVANGKVYLQTPFRKMYLPAAAGDAGGAIGAAAVVLSEVGGKAEAGGQRAEAGGQRAEAGGQKAEAGGQKAEAGGQKAEAGGQKAEAGGQRAEAGGQKAGGSRERIVLDDAYSGPQFSDEQIEALLRSRGLIAADLPSATSDLSVEYIADENELCRRTAAAIAEGKVVGWFQGRMEWGPRALGNRSILGDPRRGDMKEILNLKIKRRESFRPFAPSILREAVPEWFEQDDDVPFMMEVFQIRAEKRPLIPAVTHVDGSGRLQTVHRETNSLYYQLISEFRSLTSVPIVLNTSFNENEPVVCRPEEALDCFLRTKMDVLVLGSFIIERLPSA